MNAIRLNDSYLDYLQDDVMELNVDAKAAPKTLLRFLPDYSTS